MAGELQRRVSRALSKCKTISDIATIKYFEIFGTRGKRFGVKYRPMGKYAILVTILSAALCSTASAGLNEWRRVGPEGGRVLSLAADPKSPSTVYALTCGGVFKTANGGASWTSANSGLPELGCSGKLAIDPQNSGTVYAAACQGVFKTTDAGANWTSASAGLTSSTTCLVLSIAIDPKHPSTLYAGGNGIFKTTDGGSNWTQVSPGFQPGDLIHLLALDPQNPAIIYAAGFSRLFRSSDTGASWTPADAGLEPHIEAVAVDPFNSGTLYAGSLGQIFKSADGGTSWNVASSGLPSAPPPSLGRRQLLSLTVNPRTSGVIYALMVQYSLSEVPNFLLATSTDGGASWTTSDNSTLAANDLNTIMPDPQDQNTIYLGTNSGVLKSTDSGRHWNDVNAGLRAMSIGSVLIDSDGTIFAWRNAEFFRGTRLFKSANAGRSWVPADSGLPRYIGQPVADPQNPRTLYVLGSRPNVSLAGTVSALFKSDDEGGSWAEIWFTASPGMGPLAINPQNSNIMYAGVSICNGTCYSKVAKSIDAGHTWIASQIDTKNFGCCSSVWSLAFDPQDPNVVYAGTGDYDGTGSGLWKSVDAGASWVNLIGGDIGSFVVDPHNPRTIYVSDGLVYKTTDGGQTWTRLQGGLPGCCSPGPIAIDPQDSSTLYYPGWDDKTKTSAVFRSTNGGASWTSVSRGLAGTIYSLTTDPQHPGVLYAGTSSGLFVIDFDIQPVSKRR